MKKNALVWLLLSICFSLNAQTITELLNKADQYEKQIKEEDAYNAYKEVLKADSRHLLSLIKCSELASRIGKRQLDKATSIDFYNAAKVYAQRALTVDSTSDEANCVMAIAMGRMALVSSGKEKVINVREIKRFADAALKYNPNSYKAWHILGKWNFEVNNLNIIERAAIKLLYGGVPPASIENAIKFYE
ncbi:MAG TPA: hypothetical protein VFN30_13050, partial [Chitinophagaceae bacterium]|nr:hypothetical protein [Chitinophagaceae bacterium]